MTRRLLSEPHSLRYLTDMPALDRVTLVTGPTHHIPHGRTNALLLPM